MAKPLKLASGRVREFAASDVIDATFLARAPIRSLGGRLTLTTAVPVTTSDVTAATTVYYALYTHDLVPICDGTNWTPTTYTELSLALDSNSGHTGYQQSGTNFDLFVVNDAGTLRLGTGPAWTSDTARGTGAGTTEIERKNGTWTNKVSMTLRFGSSSGNTITVAANQGTKVGTMRASANGQCEDSLVKRFLWNTYNRVRRAMRAMESADSWTYSTASFRQMNNNSAIQLAFVRGLNEDSVSAFVGMLVGNSTGTYRTVRCGIGLDSTTAIAAGGIPGQAAVSSSGTGPVELNSDLSDYPGLGYHYVAPLEAGGGADTQTWYGDNGNSAVLSNGIIGEVTA